MNTAKIEKYIELLNAGKITELKDFLQYERQASILNENGKKPTLLTAVKKIIDDKDLKEYRPTLATIQHTMDGKPFICDGYILIRWKDERPELNAFNQLEASKSINADNILDLFEGNYYPLSPDDETIINNLDKFIKLYGKKDKIKNPFCPVVVCEITFDAYLLKRLIDVIGAGKITEVKTQKTGAGIKVETDETTSLIMAVHNPQRITEAEQNTKKFLEQIKNK